MGPTNDTHLPRRTSPGPGASIKQSTCSRTCLYAGAISVLRHGGPPSSCWCASVAHARWQGRQDDVWCYATATGAAAVVAGVVPACVRVRGCVYGCATGSHEVCVRVYVCACVA